jgi:SAM-dependent methyltransferase
MEPDKAIENSDYLSRRLEPRPGDPDYLHLVDLLAALRPFATADQLSILDFGCGGSPYRSLFPNADYRRADFEEMSDLDYAIGNDSRVDERDEIFDLILSTQVAEHVSSPSGYFAECYRLLKPGGRLICTTHGTYPDHGCPYDFQRWTADGLRRDLELAGFTVTETKKLTTNARAMMYFLQRFSGWFDSTSSGVYGPLLRGYRSYLHRRPKSWHKLADKLFGGNQVVDCAEQGHEIYVGLLLSAEKRAD